MDRRHYVRGESGLDEFAALFGDAKFRPQQRLSSGGAESHDHFRFDYSDLSFEPWTAGPDLLPVRFFVNAAFATWFPFEMFDHIGDVSLPSIDSGLFERIVKQTAGWTNKRFALEVFFIARLFTDKHDDRAA